MAPFRNLLKRPTVTVQPAIDETPHPSTPVPIGNAADGRQRPSLTIRRSRDGEPNEYKLSVVDGNGAYLPPSPPESHGFWRSPSRNNSRNLVNENEPFSISRESFDSYRRSFDISARSPVSQADTTASRTSLDSRLSRRTPRSSYSGHGNGFEPAEPAANEDTPFEDVRLSDDNRPRKRGFFSRFGDSATDPPQPPSAGDSRPSSSHHGFHFHSRKKGQTGAQGSELMTITNSVS